jgi:hypothetical protein
MLGRRDVEVTAQGLLIKTATPAAKANSSRFWPVSMILFLRHLIRRKSHENRS